MTRKIETETITEIREKHLLAFSSNINLNNIFLTSIAFNHRPFTYIWFLMMKDSFYVGKVTVHFINYVYLKKYLADIKQDL